MNIVIKNIEFTLPENIVTNKDLLLENPDWDITKIEEKTGIFQRYIATKNETAFDLAVKACKKLFSKFDKDAIDTIIFCTQSPDYIMPPNAYLIHKHFNLNKNVIAFDINQACSGYIYGLMLARSMILSKTSSTVLLITGDTYSKYIHPKDRSTRVIFGDGAAVSLIEKIEDDKGIIDLIISSSGKEFENFYIPAGACRIPQCITSTDEIYNGNNNIRTSNTIYMDGMGVLSFFKYSVPKQIRELLKKSALTVNDIDLFVLHQASKIALDTIRTILKIDKSKMYYNLANIGNLVSASIPVALKMAIEEGKIKNNSLILISGFGVGLSWGSMIIRN
ncbi:MAG: ketoacyl-ACP synthase III [Bacteroidia bacterium]|nr:ketoacyl-ACP synthase III [Bacteroidia bacterium]